MIIVVIVVVIVVGEACGSKGARSRVQCLPDMLEQDPARRLKVNGWKIWGTVGGGDWVMEPPPPSSPPPSYKPFTLCGGRLGPYTLITWWRLWCAAVCL